MKSTLMSTIPLLVLCSACASDEATREYEITGKPCGASDSTEYEFLFIPGVELETKIIGSLEEARGTCRATVDGENSFEISMDPVFAQGGVNAAISFMAPGVDMEASEQVEGSPYQALVWPHRAFAYAGCDSSDFDYTGIGITLYVSENNEGDHSDDLAAIIDDHVEDRLAQIDPAYCATSANS